MVVANGCESDPTSAKDQLLMHAAPHLVLDGLALAAHAVGADQAIICVPRGSALVEPLEDALLKRPELFVGTLTDKLLTFGLGRGVEYYDGPRSAR